MATEDFAAFAPPVGLDVNGLTITLTIDEHDGQTDYYARYRFVVINGDRANVEERDGDAVPYMTEAQITAGKAMLDALLTKAKTAVST